MATRGRPADSPKLQLLKQDPGRKAKPARKSVVRKSAITPPGLSKEESAEFDRLAQQYPLCHSGDILAETARISIDLKRLASAIKKHGIIAKIGGALEINPAVRLQQQGREQLRKYLVYLSGLSEKTVEVPDVEDDVPAIG